MSFELPVKPGDTLKPFGVSWLDSCYQQTLLPNGPWHDKIMKKLCAAAVPKLEKQLDIDKRRQMIFELLGHDFIQQYFPNSTFSPHILEPPYMGKEERTKIESDARGWLHHVLNQVAVETNCQRQLNAGADSAVPGEEMMEFLQHSSDIFRTGLIRQLSVLERRVDRAVAVAHTKGLDSRVNVSDQQGTTSSTGATFFWGHQSNYIGKSVVAILQCDPRRFSQVAAHLHGRQLCSTLRRYIWMDVLMKNERQKANDMNLEKVIRERFAKSVSRGIMEMNIKRATHSPISHVIDNAVIEIYDATAGMRLYVDKESHMKEAAKALNILYVYDRTYEPYLVYWLFPLQLAFNHGTGESEHSYELAMYLDLLNKGCFPKWPEIFAVAETVMSRLLVADPVLHQHLRTIAFISTTVNTKEFLVQLIHREKTQANLLLSTEATDSFESPLSQDLLADPLIFIRKWIGEGFVGILDTPAVVFIWDQCMMQHWSSSTIEDFCLCVILLLRDRFMAARNYRTMRKVFLSDPCKLYSVDIQKGWVHIQNKGNPAEVTAMNRLSTSGFPLTPLTSGRQRLHSEEAAGDAEVTSSPEAINSIGPFTISDVLLDITVPAETTMKDPTFGSLNKDSLSLVCDIYFGSSLLQTKTSIAVSLDRESDGHGYRVLFDDNEFKFDTFDLSEYDVEQETGGYPHAVLQLDYCLNNNENSQRTTIGWVEIPLYQRTVSTKHWEIVAGKKEQYLIPGTYSRDGDKSEANIDMKCKLQARISEPLAAPSRVRTTNAQLKNDISN